jgi:hypothetical protein
MMRAKQFCALMAALPLAWLWSPVVETTGFFVPRKADDAFWDLTSAIRFYGADGQTYRDLVGKIGLWEGYVHIAGDKYDHSYKIYVPGK